MPKVDVWLSNSVLDAAERAAELERTGVDGVFTFENAHDVFFPLVAAAPVCSLDLMTNVAIAFPRSPLHLAYAAYDLHALSGGRFRLGLGSQIRTHVERRYGATWGKPVDHMREIVVATKGILDGWQSGKTIPFRGEYTTHTLMTPIFDPGPNPFGVPKVLVGALGPRMSAMAAEVADGILVMPFNTERHMRKRTTPAIESGLRVAGRSREDIEVVAEVIVATGRDEEELAASDAARFIVAFYGSTPAYRPVLDVEGWGELQPELNARSKRGEWQSMASLIDDDVFGRIAVRGTPEVAAAEIARRFPDCDRICAYFPGYSPSDELIAEFAAAVKGAT
jgi:probable F420-dependent oxidoreductase